jgi:hypothetical protein
MKKKIFALLIWACFAAAETNGQQYAALNPWMYDHYESHAFMQRGDFHTSIKPYNYRELRKFVMLDTLHQISTKTKLGGILMNRELVKHNAERYNFWANPIFDFSIGRELENGEKISNNTRGADIGGTLADAVSIYAKFTENQTFFHQQQRQVIDSIGVIPGAGHPKPFKETGHDYAYAEGYISVQPIEELNLQLGTGKNFIGDGYRSLLLSDNSFSYPYLKFTANVWKIKYIALYAQFQEPNMSKRYTMGNPKKWGVFHYLNWNAAGWLSIGLFEAVVWQHSDSLGHRGFDFSYANPAALLRPTEYANGSPDNVLMGINIKISPLANIAVYGQGMLDEFKLEHMRARNGWWANKWGLMGGAKWFSPAGIKNLKLQAEYCMVRPFAYTHFEVLQNYGNYGQPLSHPLGANFTEWLALAQYSWKRWYIHAKASMAQHGADTPGENYGGNIYKQYTTRSKEFGNEIAQGDKSQIINASLSASYLINPTNNTNIGLHVESRKADKAAGESRSTGVYFSLRTSIDNRYWDF